MNGGLGHVSPVAEAPRLHPLAVAIGVLGVLAMVVVVVASSYQRERLRHMARKMLRPKKKAGQDGKIRDGAPTAGGLPSFAQAAAEAGNARVVKRWTQSSGRDLDARSGENLTALHYAARGGHNECVRLLLAAGADPNVQDERCVTPLHLAALGGHALSVKLLLDHHADPFREDLDRHAPLAVAEAGGNVGCARLLQRAMAKAAIAREDDAAGVTLRAGAARLDNAV